MDKDMRMTKYDFMVSGDAKEWTEEEKKLVIKRHEQYEKELRKNWEGKKMEIVGNFFAIKTGEKDERK
jgi:hypothetical protein